ncbi:hypothetical protein BIV25_45430 [Streptomyces sp. MUSC 14]|nr:hypothetical protein BIV25_45430 [Streptomyces sp. MUSC 14]
MFFFIRPTAYTPPPLAEQRGQAQLLVRGGHHRVDGAPGQLLSKVEHLLVQLPQLAELRVQRVQLLPP